MSPCFMKVPLPFIFAVIFLPLPPTSYCPFFLLASWLWLFVNAILIEVVVTTAVVTAPVFTIVLVASRTLRMWVLSFKLSFSETPYLLTCAKRLLAPARKATPKPMTNLLTYPVSNTTL